MTQKTMLLLLMVLLFVGSGCFSDYQFADVLDEQPAATGADGLRGPYGVERANVHLTNPAYSGFDVEVTMPVGEGAHHTPVVVVQGGAVAKERYRWITEHLSTRGFTVLNAQHRFDLAIFDIGSSLRALEWIKTDPMFEGRIADEPGVAIGHSLGGVVASKVWNQAGPDEIKHLTMLASLPDETDTFEADADSDRIVFSFWGTKNGNTTSEGFYEGSRAFVDAADVYTATIEGMNHYQFVEDPTAEELENDGEATIDIEDAQRTALELMDRVCDDAAGTRTFQTPPEAPWPEGVATYGD